MARMILFFEVKDKPLVTRSLRTCLAHLRYYGGSSLRPLRAAASYLLWRNLIPRLLAIFFASAVSMFWILGGLIATGLFNLIFRNGEAESKPDIHTTSVLFIFKLVIIAALIVLLLIAFHTL